MDWNALSLLPSPQAAPCMPLGLLLVAVQSTKENYERRPRSFFVLNIDNMLHIDRSFLTKTRTIRCYGPDHVGDNYCVGSLSLTGRRLRRIKDDDFELWTINMLPLASGKKMVDL
ncbi:Uncharacterized protein TCM_014532 [Theobroma cacao]|uniref:Uncharacterized protein n=1 Tax=Theobroma cacao TaxID=3641 RepID=A0A061FZK7_THECC|nr:Uncharacterized protein TCM_014532 [Theobroma cacao]